MLAVPRLRLFILNDRKYVHSAVLCAPSLRPILYNTSVILVAPNREHVSVKVIALYTSTHVTRGALLSAKLHRVGSSFYRLESYFLAEVVVPSAATYN